MNRNKRNARAAWKLSALATPTLSNELPGMEHQAVLLLCWCLQITAGLIDCEGDRCISICSAHITVDPSSSSKCSDLVMTGGTALRNKTCSSFQEVLNALATVSGYSREDCVMINLLAGTHTVSSRVTVDQNVVLVGEDSTPPSVGPQVGCQWQSIATGMVEWCSHEALLKITRNLESASGVLSPP